MSVERVRAIVLAECEPGLGALGLEPHRVPDDFDLREHGVIDSFGFLEVVGALEEELGVEIDLEDLPPEDLTVLGPLCAHVAALVEAARPREAA